jgi:flagellin
MGLRINTNLASITAQRHLGTQQQRAEHSLAALASGTRIVHASDDAAGLAISESIRGQVAGNKMARMNSFNAISAVQVAEGGLNEISNIMIRMRELGVQAASDNISETERGFLQTEAAQMLEEADRIAKTTRFGNQRLLDGSGHEQEFQVGAYGGPENVIKYKLDANATAGALGYDGVSMATKSDARSSLENVDKILERIAKMRADFGAVQSRLQVTTTNLDTQVENLSAAKSRISDTDVAYETSELASANILQNAGVSVLAQANQFPMSAMKLIS